MSDQTPTPKLVQCGWCPTIMADDYPVIYLHHREVHGCDGYSVRPIKGTDWDIAELVQIDGSGGVS